MLDNLYSDTKSQVIQVISCKKLVKSLMLKEITENQRKYY